jgi:hypothetical protein
MGSGRAYLSTLLTSSLFENRFNVIAIDSSEHNVESSMKRLLVMKRKTTIFSPPKKASNDKQASDATATTTAATSSSSCNSQFTTFSQFIQSSTQLDDLVKERNAKPTTSSTDNDSTSASCSSQFALIGLHSCGNLSNSIVNLYLGNKNRANLNSSNDDEEDVEKKKEQEEKQEAEAHHHQQQKQEEGGKLLCNVSCCYNLLNEKYANQMESERDLKSTNVQIDDSSKFPMSNYLNEIKYSLHFNIRMMACHSLDRCFQCIDKFKEVVFSFIVKSFITKF